MLRLIVVFVLMLPAVAQAQLIVAPPSGPITVIAASVGVSSAQVAAAATKRRMLVAIDNESSTATIACAFGATAALNTAGSFTITAGATRIWGNPGFVPTDAINCIASGASTPVTVEVQQ